MLDAAKPEEKAGAGAAGGVDTNVEQTRASLSKLLGDNFLRGKNKKTKLTQNNLFKKVYKEL